MSGDRLVFASRDHLDLRQLIKAQLCSSARRAMPATERRRKRAQVAQMPDGGIGGGAAVRKGLGKLIERARADEVMVVSNSRPPASLFCIRPRTTAGLRLKPRYPDQ